jgi:hypothetical protein
MEIQYKKEIYRVTLFHVEYARINGLWYVNTGGSVLDWAKNTYDYWKISDEYLEREFQKLFRDEKLDKILN